MRKIILTIAATVGLVIASVQPASASSYTNPGGCRLSKNWYVNMSATWTNNRLNYTVANSPGRLSQNPGDSISVALLVSGSNDRQPFYLQQRPDLPGRFVYRADHNLVDAQVVYITAVAPSGIRCTDQIYK